MQRNHDVLGYYSVTLPSMRCGTAAAIGSIVLLAVPILLLLLLLLKMDAEMKLLLFEEVIPPDEDLMKYSLLTQFRRQSGIFPTIALLISLAAISLSSVVAASL